jgi:hypothetical protein
MYKTHFFSNILMQQSQIARNRDRYPLTAIYSSVNVSNIEPSVHISVSNIIMESAKKETSIISETSARKCSIVSDSFISGQ